MSFSELPRFPQDLQSRPLLNGCLDGLNHSPSEYFGANIHYGKYFVPQTLSVLTESNCKYLNNSTGGMDGYGDGLPYYHSKTHEIKNTVIQDGGGGGGGATFLFVVRNN